VVGKLDVEIASRTSLRRTPRLVHVAKARYRSMEKNSVGGDAAAVGEEGSLELSTKNRASPFV